MPIVRPAAPVRIDAVELRVLHLPLVSPFTTSFGTETVREVIVVRVRTGDGDGWGEIVTQQAPLYSSEYTQGAWDVTQRFLAPALLDAAAEGVAPEQVSTVLAPFVGHRMAKAGLELAVLDAALRAEGARWASTSVPRSTACRAVCRSASNATRRPSSTPSAATSTTATCVSRSRSSPGATSPTPRRYVTRSGRLRYRSMRTPPTRSRTPTPSPSWIASTSY
jgi:hypothetical protein